MQKPVRKSSRLYGAKGIAVLLIFILALQLLLVFEKHIRPVVLTVVEYESRRHAISAFNKAVQHCVTEYPEAYDNLYRFIYSSDGSVASLQADIYKLNQLSSLLIRQLEEELEAMEDSALEIPLGSLMGLQVLSGKGPALKMYVLPESSVAVEIYDTFESAGINQTKLGVYAHFTMDVAVVLSGYSACVTADNDICLSEILILGETPENYRVDSSD